MFIDEANSLLAEERWREAAGWNVNIVYPKDYSSASIQGLVDAADSDVLFLGDPRVNIEPGPRMFDRMARVIRETGAGWVYADAAGHPRIDYQSGSIRDGFDFGPVVGVSVQAARQSGIDSAWKWGGLYDLRLRISEKHAIVRIPEPLYSASMIDARPTGQKQFDYVDPRNRDYQIEMERIATAHLKRIGAWLQPHFEKVPAAAETFPVKASVVIPVRNRERTILDAVQSALVQSADFEFNVIVVDNHSTDRTTEILRGISDSRVQTHRSRTPGPWESADAGTRRFTPGTADNTPSNLILTTSTSMTASFAGSLQNLKRDLMRWS